LQRNLPFQNLNEEGCVMISLAQRVRDYRYSKGWGPDELASRADISRTALYQIESGKTGLPRAGTLRRIAVALDVSMDDLLGHADPALHPSARSSHEHITVATRGRDSADWIQAEGAPLTLPSTGSHTKPRAHFARMDDERTDDARFTGDRERRAPAIVFEGLLMREGELMSKLHDLLHSPMGSGIARIIDELHQMAPKSKNLS
jgi:transcriptional regulator with XRE-family HTH domain